MIYSTTPLDPPGPKVCSDTFLGPGLVVRGGRGGGGTLDQYLGVVESLRVLSPDPV